MTIVSDPNKDGIFHEDLGIFYSEGGFLEQSLEDFIDRENLSSENLTDVYLYQDALASLLQEHLEDDKAGTFKEALHKAIWSKFNKVICDNVAHFLRIPNDEVRQLPASERLHYAEIALAFELALAIMARIIVGG